MCLYYQQVSNSYFYLQMFTLILVISVLFFGLCYLTESPKYLYSKGRFDDARRSLSHIADFNGVVFDHNFIFDAEKEEIPANSQVPRENTKI